jgi:prophage antirepressor-like protein
METKIKKISVKNITFPVKIQAGNMMVNLSKMATPFKKRPIDWLRSKSARIYTRCLNGVKNPTVPWTVVKYGTFDERGTWAHDRLAVYFAEWLNPEFSLQVEQALATLKISNSDVPDTFTFPTTCQTIRVEMIDGEPWFCAADICVVLGHTNPSVAIQILDEDERTKKSLWRENQYIGNNIAWFVNESGLYNLIFRSNKPEAKVFRKWVTAEVLPTLRRTGEYRIPKKERMPEKEKHLSNIMYDVCFIEDINLRTRIAEQLKNLAL